MKTQFERTFNGSPVRRAGFAGLRRNVAIAMGNSGDARFADRLRAWAEPRMKDCARLPRGRWRSSTMTGGSAEIS